MHSARQSASMASTHSIIKEDTLRTFTDSSITDSVIISAARAWIYLSQVSLVKLPCQAALALPVYLDLSTQQRSVKLSLRAGLD